MAEFEHGTMESTEQEKTFNGFVTLMTRITIGLLVLMIIMAIFFR